MLIAIAVVCGICVYAMTGCTIATIHRRVGESDDLETKAAKFFYPLESRGKGSNRDSDDFTKISLCWPLYLAIVSIASGIFGCFRVAHGITNLLMPDGRAKALPERVVEEPTLAVVTPERRYIELAHRERELQASLDSIRVERARLAESVGGEAEAGKLLALPGKIL